MEMDGLIVDFDGEYSCIRVFFFSCNVSSLSKIPLESGSLE